MKTKLPVSALLLIAMCQIVLSQNPRRFYEYEPVAITSSSLQVLAAPSINDYGDIAFSGRLTPGGGTVFLSEIGQQVNQ